MILTYKSVHQERFTDFRNDNRSIQQMKAIGKNYA